jgi:hypothetical protein
MPARPRGSIRPPDNSARVRQADIQTVQVRCTMPLSADLYLDRMDLSRHVDTETCQVCRVDSLAQLIDRLRAGQLCAGQCPHWPRERVEAFRVAVEAGQVLPAIPSLSSPRPTDVGWFDLNGPKSGSPVLITGNSQLTHQVLLAALSTITAPLWMVSVDTGGHTVDMSLVYQTLTPEAVMAALKEGEDWERDLARRVILPGLAEGLATPVAKMIGRPVEVGPICAAELPLWLAARGGRSQGIRLEDLDE